MYGAGDVRVETVPDAALREPTDAVVRVLRSAICGSDLWPYQSMPPAGQGRPMGHEFLGVVEDTGAEVSGLKRGDLMGRHKERTDLGREFGATEVIAERGEEAAERVRELTGGDGTHAVLECVGTLQALQTAFGVVRDGGVISRVGVPQYTDGPVGFGMIMRNITLTGGACPARAYIEELLPDVLDGTLQPGRVFDRTVSLEEVPDGYRAMADREVLKVLVRP